MWHEAYHKTVGLSNVLLLQQAQALLLCKLLCLGCCILPALLQMPIRVSVLRELLCSCNKTFLPWEKDPWQKWVVTMKSSWQSTTHNVDCTNACLPCVL